MGSATESWELSVAALGQALASDLAVGKGPGAARRLSRSDVSALASTAIRNSRRALVANDAAVARSVAAAWQPIAHSLRKLSPHEGAYAERTARKELLARIASVQHLAAAVLLRAQAGQARARREPLASVVWEEIDAERTLRVPARLEGPPPRALTHALRQLLAELYAGADDELEVTWIPWKATSDDGQEP